MAKREESFRVYQRMVDEKPAIVLVNEAFFDERNREGLPACIVAWATVSDVQETGLPTPEALEQLHALDESIDTAAERCGAVCPATMTRDGRRTWLIYAAKPDAVLTAIGAAAKGAGPMGAGMGMGVAIGIGVRAERDPDWKKFEEMLPTPEEARWNNDLMVIEQLEENGDVLTEPREIEHLAYFPTRGAMEAFIEWLGENGFDVMDADAGGEGRFAVEFSKVSAIEIDAIYEQTCGATVAAEELGGEYDGWQTRVIKQE